MSREVGPARGVLRPPQPAGEFLHARLPPSPRLEAVVQHYWRVRWDLRGVPPQRRETLPHPNVHLVVERGDSRVWGVQRGRFSTTLEGCGEAFGVKFRAGGFRGLLGRPVATLRDRKLPLRAVFGADADGFEAAVLAADTDSECVALAEALLLRRAPVPDADALLAAAIVDGIAADPRLLRVDDVLARWSLGRRALQRLFREYVGIGPKWTIGRYRLHEALARLEAGAPPDWAAFALDLGYYDQAHFIRDFKALIGRTPAGYLR